MTSYFGNYPNHANYDPNIPIGMNKWDELDDETEELEEDEHEIGETVTVDCRSGSNMALNPEKVEST